MDPKEKEVQGTVAIIGAGVAGCAAAGALSDYGIDFVVFDNADRPGGLWVDNYPGAGGRYCTSSHKSRCCSGLILLLSVVFHSCSSIVF